MAKIIINLKMTKDYLASPDSYIEQSLDQITENFFFIFNILLVPIFLTANIRFDNNCDNLDDHYSLELASLGDGDYSKDID